MSLDSSANLLFNIGANTDDAEANVQRFRALMGKDLDDMAGEFEDWATEIVGEVGTVGAAMTAGVAVIGAAGVGLIGMLVEAANKYEEYVSEVASGSKVTGIAAEDMSALHFAASQTSTSFETLTHGLTFFETAVMKANAGSEQQRQAFARLGITQAQLAAGEKDILPLLDLTMDGFKGLASGTERAGEARELFSRNGTEMLGFLSLGSQGLREMKERAEEMGLVIGAEDVRAMKEHKAALREMKEELEGAAVIVGREVLPVFTKAALLLISLTKAAWQVATEQHSMTQTVLSTATLGLSSMAEVGYKAAENFDHLTAEIKKTVDAIGKFGDEGLHPAQVADLKTEFSALSNVLEQVREKAASSEGEYERITGEMTHLSVELMKARAEYEKLRAEGKLSAEDAQREASALNALPAAILALWSDLRAKLEDKRREAEQKAQEAAAAATSDLVKRVQDQHTKTIEAEESDWNDEIAKLTAAYLKKGQLTAQNEKLIAELKEQGLFKMHRDQLTAYSQELLDLQQHLASIVEANMTSEDRLTLEHELELAELKRQETEKLKLTKEGSAERLILEQQFALNEKAINEKYARDLQELENSQGWQGVFGSKFGEMLKGNEELYRQWASSGNQSIMMVKVAMQDLDNISKQLFEGMAQGMGSSIMSAVVYKKSIKDAMEEAAKSELESIASRAAVDAIYATGYGFMDLAMGDYAGAAAAFESAAIFGTVAAAAGIAGRAIPSSQGGAGGSSAPGAQQQQAWSADQHNIAPNQARGGGGGVNVYIQGHVIGNSGVSELAGMLNDAVLNQDVTLTATNTRTGVQLTR